MTDSLFQNTPVDQPQIDENKNYLEELVGEGKKFKTPEDLAKGKWYADQMVEIQNKRLDDLRKDYLELRGENTAKAKLEDLINQLRTQPASSDDTKAKEDDTKPTVDLDKIKSLMNDTIKNYDQERKYSENFSQVQSKLVERFGSNYSNALKEQIQNLGLSDEQITNMAKTSPQAAIRLLGLDVKPQQETFQAPPQSRQRKDNFSPTSGADRTWAYYQELKKKNPDLYYDKKIANQMQQDAIRLGDKFNDGDFFIAGLHEQN